MKGTLDLVNENEWLVRYKTETPSGLIMYKSVPLSRFNKIMYKSQLEVDTDVEFKIINGNNNQI